MRSGYHFTRPVYPKTHRSVPQDNGHSWQHKSPSIFTIHSLSLPIKPDQPFPITSASAGGHFWVNRWDCVRRRGLGSRRGCRHRCCNVPVAEKFLDGSNVVACLEKSRGERVAKAVTTRWLGDTHPLYRGMDCSLQDGFVKVMAPQFASFTDDDINARRYFL